MDRTRKIIAKALKEKRLEMKAVSEELGYNHAYMQQFLERGVPRQLKEKDLRKLAGLLDLDPEILGLGQMEGVYRSPADRLIDEIDVTAGLGGGGLSIIENTTVNGVTFHREAVRDHWRLPDSILSRFNAQPHHIKAFPSKGDSMYPQILDGDVVFADTRHRVPSPPGVYVLADQFGGVVVKNLEVISRPNDDPILVRVSSSNPKYLDQELTLDEIFIIGIYAGRFTAN